MEYGIWLSGFRVEEQVVGNVGGKYGFGDSQYGGQPQQQQTVYENRGGSGDAQHDFSRNSRGRAAPPPPPPSRSIFGAVINYVSTNVRRALFAMLGVIIRRVVTSILQRIFRR